MAKKKPKLVLAKAAPGRSTVIGMRERIGIVRELLLKGYTRSYIIRFSKEEWKRSTRQTDEYIRIASSEIDEANANSAERNLALITANLWKVYRENLLGSPGVARQALMDIAKLRGLDKLEINLNIDRPLEEMSDQDLEDALSNLPEAHD